MNFFVDKFYLQFETEIQHFQASHAQSNEYRILNCVMNIFSKFQIIGSLHDIFLVKFWFPLAINFAK